MKQPKCSKQSINVTLFMELDHGIGTDDIQYVTVSIEDRNSNSTLIEYSFSGIDHENELNPDDILLMWRCEDIIRISKTSVMGKYLLRNINYILFYLEND